MLRVLGQVVVGAAEEFAARGERGGEAQACFAAGGGVVDGDAEAEAVGLSGERRGQCQGERGEDSEIRPLRWDDNDGEKT